jgi:hypothetical protein
MLAVVAAKGQDVQDRRQHAPVVVGIGAMDQGLDALAEGRTRCIALLDQRAEGLLSDQGKKDLAHGAVGVLPGSCGDAKEQPCLVLDLVDLPDQIGSDPLLGSHPDAVNDLDEEVHQPVGDLPAPLPAECRQQCLAHPRGMATQVPGGLGPHPAAVRSQDLGGDPLPQALRQCQVANQLQLSHLRFDAGQTDRAGVGLQHAQAERRAAAVRHIVQIPRVPLHQRIKPSPSLRSQGPRDLSEKPLFKGMDCCPDQTLGVLFGWQLQALLSASVCNRDPQVCRLRRPLGATSVSSQRRSRRSSATSMGPPVLFPKLHPRGLLPFTHLAKGKFSRAATPSKRQRAGRKLTHCRAARPENHLADPAREPTVQVGKRSELETQREESTMKLYGGIDLHSNNSVVALSDEGDHVGLSPAVAK